MPGNGTRARKGPGMSHQTILIYARGKDFVWNGTDPSLRAPYAQTSQAMHFTNTDAEGRVFRERVVNGKTYKYYADQGRAIGSVWTDCPSMVANTPLRSETTGYPTQKPLKLLDRIVRAASPAGRSGDRSVLRIRDDAGGCRGLWSLVPRSRCRGARADDDARAAAGGGRDVRGARGMTLVGRDIEVPLAGHFSVRARAIDVGPGITTLRGPSGSGKSTLLRALATLAPFRGTLSLDGVVIWTSSAQVYRRRVAFVPQTPPMLAATVADEVNVGPGLRGVTLAPEAIDVLLSDVDLDPAMRARAPASLSGGEKQRLALARALANEPEVLLLDEPTSALDAASATHVLAMIQKLGTAGRAILLTSHREADLALGTAAYRMEQGNVVAG